MPYQSFNPAIESLSKYWSSFPAYKEKRDGNLDNHRNLYDDYPLLIKIEEKRKPTGNIRPYCEQMQILDNLDIVPIGTVAQIPVPEVGAMDAPASRRLKRRDDYLSQNCACEWISG